MSDSKPDAGSSTAHTPMERIGRSVSDRYAADRRLLTFEQFLETFLEDPYPLARNAVQYLRDAIEHYGEYQVAGIGGPERRWRIFDADYDEGHSSVIGQEAAQHAIVEAVSAAADEGRLDRMLVLHGPNGSGKSSLVESLQRGLEDYSHQPEGAMYALRWIFPKTPEGSELGFGARQSRDDGASFALLEPDEIASRVVCELRDNPLYVIPDSERAAFLETALDGAPEDRRKESYWSLLHGNLSPKSKQIYEGLLAAYHGDWREVVRHVQVERVYVSRRFRIGAVVTQPQGTHDAQLHGVAGNSWVAGLPPFLQSIPLYEVVGDLADANRGLLEFSDFLKRNLELSKYLLQTTEKGFVSIGHQLVELDIVFMATVNERHLEAFKQLGEFASFQARMTFVRVPYLRELADEQQVYDRICGELSRHRPVAPHIPAAAALFGVLTRMRRPDADAYPARVRDLVRSLTPLEKVRLYAGRTPGDRFTRDELDELQRLVPRLRDEYARDPVYEGRIGASVRDLRTVLLRAAVRGDDSCLGPSAFVSELVDLISEPSLYRFLQVDSDAEYHDAAALLRATTRQLAEWVLADVQDALALVSEEEYERRFDAYFHDLLAATKGERVRDPVTGRMRDPDAKLLEWVEGLLPIDDDVASHRRRLVSRIGAWAVDNPDERPLDFRRIFPDLFKAVKRDFYDRRQGTVLRVLRHALLQGTDDFDLLSDDDRTTAERLLENLGAAGYSDACARDALGFVLEHLPESEGA